MAIASLLCKGLCVLKASHPHRATHKLYNFPGCGWWRWGGWGGGAWAPSCPAAEPPPPPLPPSRLPPPSALPTPSRYAEQGKGHIDPLLKGSWSRTNLKSLQPQAGASWPIGPRDSGAGVELQSLGGTARQLVRVEIGKGLAWAPSFHSSVCLKLLEQLSAEGSLPASEARGRQTCNADTHPTPTNTSDSKGAA